MLRRDEWKIIGFAAAVCIICSLVLASTANALRDRQAELVENDRKLNVLKAFGVNILDASGKKISGEEINRYFEDHISEVFLDKETGKVLEGITSVPKEEAKAKTSRDKTVLPLYVWKDKDEPTKYAFPISGMGLWSILHGYLALDRDLATIVGLTFYKHAETPGLGGECSADWFQDQFKGKKVWKDGELLNFEVVKGTVLGKYPDGSDRAVDGMSGATMTGNGINEFLNRDMNLYDKYFRTIRGS